MWTTFFDGPALWFSVPAALGTGLFLIRLVFMSLGGDHAADVGTHGDVVAGNDAMHMHGDSTNQLEFFSIQSFFALLMGFGWGGLGAYKGSGLSIGMSVLIAMAAGSGLALMLAYLMRGVKGLAASGNVPLLMAQGAVGEVYVGVPEKGKGTGEVKLVIQDRQRMVNAVSDGPAYASKSRVKVSRVNADNTVTVEGI